MAAITLEELLKQVDLRPEKLDEPTSDDHLLKIALFLTSWRTVAPHLGLSEIDMDDVEQEGKSEQEKRQRALQKWKHKLSRKATYRKLVEVLLSLGKADVADEICGLLKGMSEMNMYHIWMSIHSLVKVCLPLKEYPPLLLTQFSV